MAQREVSTYQELVEFVFKNGGVVIADFYTTWCGPCKLVAPTLEALRKEFAISVAKVDTDKADELSARFDIHAIPTYILLKKSGGEIAAVETVVSAHTTKLRKLFEEGQNIRSSKN